jgi:hypothetical protein
MCIPLYSYSRNIEEPFALRVTVGHIDRVFVKPYFFMRKGK